MNEKKPSIHQGHRERLRERYRENGVAGFQDHELLELLLGYSIAQKDTNPIAHELLSRYGDLRGVFESDPSELLKVPGIGEYSAFLLTLLPGITQRYYEECSDSTCFLDQTEKQLEFMISRFIGRKEECLYAAFLNENYRLIQCELQYEGSINAVEIHATRILRTAIKLDATYVIIAHNHLTDAYPSDEDIRATSHLYYKLKEMKIDLLDHIVVSGTTATSMKESGHFAKATY